MGDRLDNLSRAVSLIDHIPLTCVVQVSHAYETQPAYGISSSVANAVVEIRTELHPLVLLDELPDMIIQPCRSEWMRSFPGARSQARPML